MCILKISNLVSGIGTRYIYELVSKAKEGETVTQSIIIVILKEKSHNKFFYRKCVQPSLNITD